MNVVYPIRNVPSSVEEDTILKYSLRSLERHGVHVENVYVLGARRKWFSKHVNVVDLDLYGVGNKQESKFKKVGEKLQFFSSLENPFLLMNDDFILLKDMDVNEKKWYYSGSIQDVMKDPNKGWSCKQMLHDTCEEYGTDPAKVKNFATHTPFLVDEPQLVQKGKYHKSMKQTSFRQSFAFVRGIVDMDPEQAIKMNHDVKVYTRQTVQGWLNLFESNRFISFNNDTVANKNLMNALHERFPKQSRYEVKDGI